MIGLALPRRFLAAIFGFCALLAWSDARAQDPSTEPNTVTVIGGDASARRCTSAVNANDLSDAAIGNCEQALRYPRLTAAAAIQIRANLGVLRLRRGEHQAAAADFDAVIVAEPNNAEAHMNRGAALIQLRQYGPAVTALTEALSLGVREPHKAYLNRGAAREALRDLRGAYEDYSTALEIQPDWGPANAELARFARTRRDRLAGMLETSDAE